MKTRIILIAVTLFAFLLLAVGLIFWKMAHVSPRRYVIAKKRAEAVSVRKRPAVAPEARRVRVAKVAIVIDDFGYTMKNVNTFLGIGQPITLSILPELPYSSRVSETAHSRGYEVILHLPLEPKAKEAKEEADTIKSGMKESDIIARLDKEISSVPYIAGVSNHQGSKATEDKELMLIILKDLKKRGLYFFDSLTSEKSVCGSIARSIGIRYAKRDIFLDNSTDPVAIEKELQGLKRIAKKKGRAIAICHDRENTAATLAKIMPEMAADGIEFVSLSEMVK